MNSTHENENLNGWTPNLTKRLKVIKARCWSYTWIHRENSIFLNDIYDWVSVIAYGLSFFNGIILIFPNNVTYIRVLSILLSFGSGILIFYMKNKRLTETAEKHRIASSKFSNIYNNIARQLSMDSVDRKPAQVYHEWITQVYDTLFGSAPDIDPPVMEEYVRKFARKRRVNPIEAAEFDASDDNSERESTSDTGYNSFVNEVVVVDKKGDEVKKKDPSSNDKKKKMENNSTNIDTKRITTSSLAGMGSMSDDGEGIEFTEEESDKEESDKKEEESDKKESDKKESDKKESDKKESDKKEKSPADDNKILGVVDRGKTILLKQENTGKVKEFDLPSGFQPVEETGEVIGSGETGPNLLVLGGTGSKEIKTQIKSSDRKKFRDYELERMGMGMGLGMSDLLATPRSSIPEYELEHGLHDSPKKKRKKKK